MKKPLTRFLVFLFIVTLMPAQDAFAAWQIHYSGKAAKMFGYGGRGNFATKSQCESYRTSRPGFESMNSYCSGFDAAPAYRPPSGQSSASASGGQAQQPDPAALAAQRLQEEQAAKQRAQIAAMERQAAALQQQQFDQGKSTLAGDLRNRLNASGGANGQALSDCWAARAGEAAQRGDRAGAKNYADYSIAAREGKSVPACHAGQSPAVPMPQGVTLVDDDPARRFTEEKLQLDNRIAALHGKQEETRATAEKKRAAVETLEKISRSATDPKAKQETDTLLAEAKNTLAEALEEDRRATEEIGRAESELKALNERGPAPRPGATATR
jgi:predicted nucleic acid-binding protein